MLNDHERKTLREVEQSITGRGPGVCPVVRHPRAALGADTSTEGGQIAILAAVLLARSWVAGSPSGALAFAAGAH